MGAGPNHDIVASVRRIVGEDRIAHVHRTPARSAQYAPWPQAVHPDVVAAYERIGVTRPWRHQAEALHALDHGESIVIATGTGSGKSLPVWAEMFSLLARHEEAIATGAAGSIARRMVRPTMVYLAPTKALGADQVAAARGIIAAGNLPAVVTTCDGDSSSEEKKAARARADVIATNPDFVHYSLLASHARWARLLRGLHLIVLDEAHAYRGLFGAHVALVLRRLIRAARTYGADPVVVFLSATAADPHGLAAAMLGESGGRAQTITEDGSPTGARDHILVRPDDDGSSDAAPLLADLVTHHHRTLMFVRSRYGAEAMAAHVRDLVAAADAKRVASYRGGYLPEERRQLEAELRCGGLVGLTATSALELGIDISGLDAVITSGWPGSRASLLQQAGRAGRAGSDGVAIFAARDDALDSYLVEHPEEIFAAGVEPTVINVANPHVLVPHLLAAASEFPLTPADFPLFGLGPATESVTPPLIEELLARDLLKSRPAGWMYNTLLERRAHDLTDLRGSGARDVAVVESETGRLLGTVSAGSADSSVHEGAIYLHQGQQFLVRDYDGQAAVAEPIQPQELRTVARSETSVEVLDVVDSADTVALARVDVATQVTGFDRRRAKTGEIISSQRLKLPQRHLQTVAWQWHVPAGSLEATGLAPGDIPGALHAAEHALISLLPLIAHCDRWDIGGVSFALHGESLEPTIFVYDGARGGAGFAAAGFEHRAAWVARTRDAVADCPCEAGCPRCIVSPKCGSGNEPLSKPGAIAVLDIMAAQISVPPEPAH